MGESQPLTLAEFLTPKSTLKLIATDMDGTLTRQGKFTADLLLGLERLRAAHWPVVIVTGRSAGWVNGLAHYLPIAGAMAENGGVYFPGTTPPELLVSGLDLATHRQQLSQVFAQLQRQWPHLQESDDNPFRLTDWTFAIDGLSPTDLAAMAATCQRLGWGFTYSTVQCHIFKVGQSKAAGLKTMLQRYFPTIAPAAVVTVGDSPNDESLFDQGLFPYAVGVANLKHYWEHLSHRPAWVTQAPEVDGFLELVEALLTA
jgi:hydroxymethylpyrimidine pyrophosphatase-like HAD family hydrolase